MALPLRERRKQSAARRLQCGKVRRHEAPSLRADITSPIVSSVLATGNITTAAIDRLKECSAKD